MPRKPRKSVEYTPAYYESKFNQLHGRFGTWEKFCALVQLKVQAREMMRRWGEDNKPMTPPTYYKWRDRALEVSRSGKK